MIESCEILVTEWGEGQVVAGEIIFAGGKLSFSATKGYETLMQNIMEDKTFIAENVFDPAKDPRAWLRSLPSFYTGSIVRARLGGPFFPQRNEDSSAGLPGPLICKLFSKDHFLTTGWSPTLRLCRKSDESISLGPKRHQGRSEAAALHVS
jgi:hypothetical protein